MRTWDMAVVRCPMNMGSPYDELEVQARVALTEMLRESHTNEAAQNAFSKSASDPRCGVLSWGRKFERDITDIFAETLDFSISKAGRGRCRNRKLS